MGTKFISWPRIKKIYISNVSPKAATVQSCITLYFVHVTYLEHNVLFWLKCLFRYNKSNELYHWDLSQSYIHVYSNHKLNICHLTHAVGSLGNANVILFGYRENTITSLLSPCNLYFIDCMLRKQLPWRYV